MMAPQILVMSTSWQFNEKVRNCRVLGLFLYLGLQAFALVTSNAFFDYIHTWLQLVGGRWHARWSWPGSSKNMTGFGTDFTWFSMDAWFHSRWLMRMQQNGEFYLTMLYCFIFEVQCIVDISYSTLLYIELRSVHLSTLSTDSWSIEADGPSPLRKPRWRRRLWRNAASSYEWHHKDLKIS